jgi:DNA invertase Pin-like site-specific DNA recombinase
MSAIPLIPAAEYLRVSTEHQQYSLEFQNAVIRSYAMRHNFFVVQKYTDEGRSGLVLRHREGLAQLLHDVVAGGQLYRVILVYDISRWGDSRTSTSPHTTSFCASNRDRPYTIVLRRSRTTQQCQTQS